MCIATAQATTQHRHGKRTLSEIYGGREVLQSLKQAHASITRPTVQLHVVLPVVNKAKEAATMRRRASQDSPFSCDSGGIPHKGTAFR